MPLKRAQLREEAETWGGRGVIEAGAPNRPLKVAVIIPIMADDGVWRFAFAFDQQRRAVILVGGDKEGEVQAKFYKKLIDVADRRFAAHVELALSMTCLRLLTLSA